MSWTLEFCIINEISASIHWEKKRQEKRLASAGISLVTEITVNRKMQKWNAQENLFI